jgi:hypothetical protein
MDGDVDLLRCRQRQRRAENAAMLAAVQRRRGRRAVAKSRPRLTRADRVILALDWREPVMTSNAAIGLPGYCRPIIAFSLCRNVSRSACSIAADSHSGSFR